MQAHVIQAEIPIYPKSLFSLPQRPFLRPLLEQH